MSDIDSTNTAAGEEILRTFIAYVEDRPGVLNRVTSLVRRRAYNIESLTVGRTHAAGISRVTLIMKATADGARRLEANLYKLVDVLHVRDITHHESVARDLALIKVREGEGSAAARLRELCREASARIVQTGGGVAIIEMVGTLEQVDRFVATLEPLGLLEMVRSGLIAMTCGPDTPRFELGTPSELPIEELTAPAQDR